MTDNAVPMKLGDAELESPLLYSQRYPWMQGLSWQQVEFVAAYAGDITAASAAAGITAKTGRRWIEKVEAVQRSLAMRRESTKIPDLISTQQEREMFLTGVQRDRFQPMPVRLKALEMLGKSQGDYIERVQVEGTVGHEHRVAMSLDDRAKKMLGLSEDDCFVGDVPAEEVAEEDPLAL